MSAAPRDSRAATTSPSEAVASHASPTADVTPTERDARRYAQLEAESPDAADFEGGSRGLYIGISTGAAIVLIAGALLLIFLL